MSVPKLRFKDENGRDFPDWKNIKLDKIISERSEISDDAKVPTYSLTIQDGVTPKTDRYEREHLVTDTSNAYKLVKQNDFAYNPMNLRFGAIARYYGEQPVKVSKYYNIFYCNESFNPFFFEAYLKTSAMISFYDKMATGSLVEKKRVHFGDFIKFKIPVPTSKEQNKIADFLIAVDEKIAQLTQKCELLARYKQGVMQQIFSQEVRFKDDDGRDFPDWKNIKLDKIISERSEISDDAEVPTYSLTIQDGVTPKTDRYEREHLVTDTSNAYKLVKKNDFAYNPMNLRFGAIARYYGEQPVKVSKYYNIFYCNESFNPFFFEAYLKTSAMLSFYDKMATGSLVEKKRVHFGDFIKFKIPVPTPKEQNKIANFLTSIDEKITEAQTYLDTVKQYKQGLLQQMFV